MDKFYIWFSGFIAGIAVALLFNMAISVNLDLKQYPTNQGEQDE